MTDGGRLDGRVGSLLRWVRGPPGLHGRLAVARLLAQREVVSGPSMPLTWRQRLSLWRHGFTSRSGVLFDVVDGEYRDYLSDYRFELLDELGGKWSKVISNKLTMQLLLSSFEDHLPEIYGVLLDGELRRDLPAVSAPPAALDADASDVVAQVDAYLQTHGAVVLKPVYGYAGKGISVCRTSPDGEGRLVDGEPATPEEFAALVTGLDEYLVCEFVEQAAYAESLFPDSTNTLRVITLRDPETDEPFVSDAVHRIGTAESAPVDNWSRGGLSAEVRPDGTLSSAAQWSPAARATLWHDTHPDTGSRIEGRRVPNWSAIRERILELSAVVPYLPRIGWDVVVTDDGGFVVIEINAHPGIESIQTHGPLLSDPRVRRFYEHHGYA